MQISAGGGFAELSLPSNGADAAMQLQLVLAVSILSKAFCYHHSLGCTLRNQDIWGSHAWFPLRERIQIRLLCGSLVLFSAA